MRLLPLLLAVVTLSRQYEIQLKCQFSNVWQTMTIRTFEGYTLFEIENKDCSFSLEYGKPYVALKQFTRKSPHKNGILSVQGKVKKIGENESWQCDSKCDILSILAETFVAKLVFAVADYPNFHDKPDIPFAEYNPGPGKFYPCDSPTSSKRATGCRLKASYDFIIYKFENVTSCRTPKDRKELGFPVRRMGNNNVSWEWVTYKSCVQAQVIGEDIQDIPIDPFYAYKIEVGDHGQFTRLMCRYPIIYIESARFLSINTERTSGISTRYANSDGGFGGDKEFSKNPYLPEYTVKKHRYDVESYPFFNIKWPLKRFSANIGTYITELTARHTECTGRCPFNYHTEKERYKQHHMIVKVPYENPRRNGEVFRVRVESTMDSPCNRYNLERAAIEIAYNKLSHETVCFTRSGEVNAKADVFTQDVDCLAEEQLHIAVYRQQCFRITIIPAEYILQEVNTIERWVFKPNPPGDQGLWRLVREKNEWLFGSLEIDWKGCQKEDRVIWITDHKRFTLKRNSSNFHNTKPDRIYADFYHGEEKAFYKNYHDHIRVALPLYCNDAVVTMHPFMKPLQVTSDPWMDLTELWDDKQMNPTSAVLSPHDEYIISKGKNKTGCEPNDKLVLYAIDDENDRHNHDKVIRIFKYGDFIKDPQIKHMNLGKYPFVMWETSKPSCFHIEGKAITKVTGEVNVVLDNWKDELAGGFNVGRQPPAAFQVNVLNVTAPPGYEFAKVKITFEDCEVRRKRVQVQTKTIKEHNEMVKVDPTKPFLIKFFGDDCVNAFVYAPDREIQKINLLPVPKDGIHLVEAKNDNKIIEVHVQPEHSVFKRFEVIRDRKDGACKDQHNPIQAWFGQLRDHLETGETVSDTYTTVQSRYSELEKVVFKLPKNQCYKVRIISIYEHEIQEHLTFTNVTIKSTSDSASIRVIAKDRGGPYWSKAQITWNDKAECVAKKKTAFLHLDLFSGDNTVKLQHLQGITGIKNDFPITVGYVLQLVSNAFDCYTIKLISSWEFASLPRSPFQRIDLVEIQSNQYPKKNVLFEVTSNIANYFWYTMNIQGLNHTCNKEDDILYFGVFGLNEKEGFERLREFKCGYTEVKDALIGDGRSSKIRVALYYKEDPVFTVFLEPRETKKVLDDSTPYEVVDVPPTEEGQDQRIIIPWTHGGTWREFAFVNVSGIDCKGIAPEIRSIKWTPENKKRTRSFEEFRGVQNWDKKQLSGERFTPSSLEGYKVTIRNGCMKLQKQSAAVKKNENLNPLENSKQLTADNNNGNVLDISIEGKTKFAAIKVIFDNCPNTENLNYEVHIVNKYKKTIVALKEGQKSQTTTSSGEDHSSHHTFQIGVPDPCAKVQMMSFTDASYTTNGTWDPNLIQRHTVGPGNVVFNVVKQPDGISSEFESMTISGLPLGEKCDKDAMIFITIDGKTAQKIKYSDVEKSSKSISGAGKKISILTPNDCFKVIAIPKKEAITKVLGLYVNSNDFITDRPQLLTIKSEPSAKVFEGLRDRFTVESNNHYEDIEQCQGKKLKFTNAQLYDPIGSFNALKDNEYKYGDNATTYKYLSTKDFVIDVDNQCFSVTVFSGGALEKLDINPDTIQGVSNKQSVPKYIYLKVGFKDAFKHTFPTVLFCDTLLHTDTLHSTTGKPLGKPKLKRVTRKSAKGINGLDYENTCPRSQIEVGGKTYLADDIPEDGTIVPIDSTDTLLKMDSPCIQLIFGDLDKNAKKCLIPLKLAHKNEFTKSSTCEGKTIPRKFIKPEMTDQDYRRFEPKLEISKNENATGCTPSSGMYIYLENNGDDVKDEAIRYSDVEYGPYEDFYPKHVDPTNFVFILSDDCFKITFLDEDLYEGYSNDIPDKKDNSNLLVATIILWCLFVIACMTFAIAYFMTMPPTMTSGAQGAKLDSIIL